jgi:hypothetical protein
MLTTLTYFTVLVKSELDRPIYTQFEFSLSPSTIVLQPKVDIRMDVALSQFQGSSHLQNLPELEKFRVLIRVGRGDMYAGVIPESQTSSVRPTYCALFGVFRTATKEEPVTAGRRS